jgi:hypothetical protein
LSTHNHHHQHARYLLLQRDTFVPAQCTRAYVHDTNCVRGFDRVVQVYCHLITGGRVPTHGRVVTDVDIQCCPTVECNEYTTFVVTCVVTICIAYVCTMCLLD